jgi:predicted ATP-grasp superfamily ATP-dependent carboligase
VTDADERTALACVRSLGRLHEVHVAGPGERSLAGASRHCHRHHQVPDALTDPSAFRTAVTSRALALEIDLLIPVTDAASRALLPSAETFAPTRLAGATFAAYELLSHKARLLELAADAGIEAPPGALANTAEEARRCAEELGLPVVFKPVESVSSDDTGTSSKRSVVRVSSMQEIPEVWEMAVGAGQALVQKLVPGWGEGLFLLRWQKQTRAVFAHRRLREFPPTGGVSVLREGIPTDPELQRRVEAMLDAAEFDGVVMAEFRTDGATRWLMEFNARLWGSLQLAVESGVDFPALLTDAALGAPAMAPPPYAGGARSRWLLGELDHAIALARGRGAPDGPNGVASALGVLLRPAGRGTRWEVLRREDPVPFLYELRSWLSALGRT